MRALDVAERHLGLKAGASTVRGPGLQAGVPWRGANALFPEAWEGYLAPMPAAERGDLLHAYHRRLAAGSAGGAPFGSMQQANTEPAIVRRRTFRLR